MLPNCLKIVIAKVGNTEDYISEQKRTLEYESRHGLIQYFENIIQICIQREIFVKFVPKSFFNPFNPSIFCHPKMIAIYIQL